jgi:hypothetical protein
MKHPHVDRMFEYAEDALKTERPWERWQIRILNDWFDIVTHPEWNEFVEYRRKPDQKDLDIDGFNEWYKCVDTRSVYLSDAWKAALEWERSKK